MLLLLALTPARAMDADTYEPAGSNLDAQGGLQLLSPTLGWPGSAYAGLGLVYAHNPVVKLYDDGTEEAVVGGSFATRVMAGYNVRGALRIDLDLPLYPYVGGAGADWSGFTTGDARIGATIPLLKMQEEGGFALAVAPSLSLPTGSIEHYTGTGSVGAGLALAGRYDAGKIFIDANVGGGAYQASSLGELQFGSALNVGAGAGFRAAEAWTVGAELDSAIGLAGGVGPWQQNPVELHAYGTYGTGSGLTATLGVGTGIVAGVGAPDVRVIGQVGYRLPGKKPVFDTDADGIMDPVDQCVDVAEDKDQFEDEDGCPEVDNDHDQILDVEDRCPNNAEDEDDWEDGDGCPDPDNDADGVPDVSDLCPINAGPAALKGCPDKDGDTVIDREDACPDDPGPVNTRGCPDRDTDEVPDSRDKCPDEPKDPRENPARSDGCPKRVFVSQERIEILDKIYFDTNKTTIKKQSFALLAEIATTLNNNPDIVRIEVAGHTDSDGNDAANLKLSQGRAEAVVKWLTTNGKVDAERLFAVGYGETKPMDTNATSAGKANNRRVEFVIKAIRPGAPPPPVQE